MSQGSIKQGSVTIVYPAVLKLHSKQYSVFHSYALASVSKKAQHTTTSHTREQLPVIRMAATQVLSLFFYIKTNFMLQVYYDVAFPKLQVIAVEIAIFQRITEKL